MDARHTSRHPNTYWLLLPCLSMLVAVLVFLSLGVRSAEAASLHTTTAASSFSMLVFDPNIVFLLFVVAMMGIYVELSHPGAILPGVVGAIALLLFLLSAGSLSPDWAGFALMVLASLLLVLDVKLPAHGTLTVGAVIALIVGSLLFFNTGNSGPQIDPVIVYVMGCVIGLIGLSLVAFVVRARRRAITTGVESMIGASVEALTPLQPEGRVNYAGENWAAVLDPPDASADPGSELQIVAVEGLRLHVRTLRIQALIGEPAFLRK